MSDNAFGLVGLVVAVLRQHGELPDSDGVCECGFWSKETDWPGHVAEAVTAALVSWDFLMAILDENYPEDIFPTMEDTENRDPGPRIVSLLRWVDQLRTDLEAAQRLLRNPDVVARLSAVDPESAVEVEVGEPQ